jgi:hypothetical protein
VQQALTQARAQGPANLLRYAAQGGQAVRRLAHDDDLDRLLWRRLRPARGGCTDRPGANHPVDAIYPRAAADKDGKPLDGANRYVVHFKAGQLPPVRAFWSLTAYNKESYTDPTRSTAMPSGIVTS